MDFVDHLKSSVDIVRTVGEYVRLRKIGARYSGLCPFHTEKTPSFSVNPGPVSFICFGCGKKGDVLTFVQEIEQLTFYETLKLLAERNGLTDAGEARPARSGNRPPRRSLRVARNRSRSCSARHLWGDNGSEARDYLRRRGLTAKRLPNSSDWDLRTVPGRSCCGE